MVNRYDNRDGDERTEGISMRLGEMYEYINYPRRDGGCVDKTKYPTFADAAQAALDYARRVLFARMNAYHCARCEWWHIGHDNKRWWTTPQFRKDVEWFIMWEKRG